ncbi:MULTISPECIES: hypothetical protein [unclassified Streptomyces]|uniref:hypothetical protein n=1 Tax=unclassified Streptomyces TaxID=2593676 RepID=UPI00344CF2A7
MPAAVGAAGQSARARADDPRIAPPAADPAGAVPQAALAVVPEGGPVATGFGRALLDDCPPAQREVVRRVMDALGERTRGRTS